MPFLVIKKAPEDPIPPPPPPPPPDPDPTIWDVNINAAIGPLMDRTTLQTIGALPASYDQMIVNRLDAQWGISGAYWGGQTQGGSDGHEYYGRSIAFYREGERLKNIDAAKATTFKSRGDQMLVNLRTNFFIPNAYNHSFSYLWTYGEAWYIHWKIGQDGTASKDLSFTGLRRMGDWFTSPNFMPQYGIRTDPNNEYKDGPNFNAWIDNRWNARALNTLVYCHLAGATSLVGRNFQTALQTFLDGCINIQTPDGAFRQVADDYQSKPFYSGLLLQALINYYERVFPDTRIPPVVKKSLDHNWNDLFVHATGCFRYQEGPNISNEGPDSYNVIYSGNNYLTPAFWWYYKISGDTLYRDRGDMVFAGHANFGAWSSKEFNQFVVFLGAAWTWRGTAPFNGAAVNRAPPLSFTNQNMTDEPFTGTGGWYHQAASTWNGTYRTLDVSGKIGFATTTAPRDTHMTFEVDIERPPTNAATFVTLFSAGANEVVGTGISQRFSTTTGGTDLGNGRRRLKLQGVLLPSAINTIANLEYLNCYIGSGPDANTGSIRIHSAKLYAGDKLYEPPLVPFKVTAGPPSITGSHTVGSVATLNEGTWKNGVTSYRYQWYRNGIAISGATGKTYTYVTADRAREVNCLFWARNAAGEGTPIMVTREAHVA